MNEQVNSGLIYEEKKNDSISEMDGNYVLETRVNENYPQNSQFATLKEGMWLVVRFTSKKTENHFVG